VAAAFLKDAGLLFPRIFQCRYVFKAGPDTLIWAAASPVSPPSPLSIKPWRVLEQNHLYTEWLVVEDARTHLQVVMCQKWMGPTAMGNLSLTVDPLGVDAREPLATATVPNGCCPPFANGSPCWPPFTPGGFCGVHTTVESDKRPRRAIRDHVCDGARMALLMQDPSLLPRPNLSSARVYGR
jgi:hypothetical protein